MMRPDPTVPPSAIRFLPGPGLCLVAMLAAFAAFSFSEQPGSEEHRSYQELLIHSGRIEAIAFAPAGATAASASRDGTVKLWDVATRRECGPSFKGKSGYTSIAFSPKGHTLAAAGFDGTLSLLDTETGRDLTVAASSTGSFRALTFSPDGASLVVGGDDQIIRVFDPASGREMRVLRLHTGTVLGLAHSPDGSEVVSVGVDGRVVRWDPVSGRVREQFFAGSGPLWSVAYAPDGRSLALGGLQGIEFRELSTGRSRRWKSLRGPVTTVCYLPGGTTLASSSFDGAIVLWDTSSEQVTLRGSLNGQASRVKALAISPDGGAIVTGGDDAVLRFWELTHDSPTGLTAPARPEDRADRCFTPCEGSDTPTSG
jgi:WD40 repeat protein